MSSEEELKELARENLEVSKEALRVVKKINSARLWGNFFSFLKMVVVVGISVGAFYYIEPYMQLAMNALNESMSLMGQMKKTGESLNQINTGATQDLLKKVQEILPKKQ